RQHGALVRSPVRRPGRYRRAPLRGHALVPAAAPARSGRAPRHALGDGREPRPGRSALQPEPGRASVLRDRPAPRRLAPGATLRGAGAGVQLPPPVRPPPRRRPLRQDAGRHPPARHGPAGQHQPEPGRLRHRGGDAPVQRPQGRGRLDLPVPRAEAQMSGGGETVRIAPCSGHAVELEAGDELVVIDPMGQQVSDRTAFCRDDRDEYLASGASIDYASKLWLSTGDVLYSNRSRVMFTILEDTCGRHDFTLTPCSKEMFEKLYGEEEGRPG